MAKKVARQKPTKGTMSQFVAAVKGCDDDPVFLDLYRQAHERALVPYKVFLDPYGVARRLTTNARTWQDLQLARALVSYWSPSGPLFETFMRELYIPRWKTLAPPGELRRCEECFREFPPTDARDRFCNSTCAGRSRNRGRQKLGNGKSAAENAAHRRELAVQKHWKKCAACKVGSPCPQREGLFQSSDALSHLSGRVTPETAENLAARDGRRPKRSVKG